MNIAVTHATQMSGANPQHVNRVQVPQDGWISSLLWSALT